MLKKYQFINYVTYTLAFFIYIGISSDLCAQEVDFYAEKVRPILSDKCFFCHGPDQNKREADLRLDVREDAVKNRAVVPGKPEQSEIIKRVKSHEADEQMPPASSPKKITEAEIRILEDWIKNGAQYSEHWAFKAVTKPKVPVERSDWINNEIDAFTYKRMKEHGLAPSPVASKEELLRRLSFDLTGLPPTLEEMEQYLKDNSQDAYEKLVDRLLSSPHFGERLAADWLDISRYSDSYGYQVDRDRFVWPWRDWVVNAINENMSYRDFVIWQLAGDLLPEPTQDQRMATTFCRLHPQKVEGGSTPEEFRSEYVSDRVQTYGTAFLGLTLDCSRCHNHKFDPIGQKEFYQLYSFFNNIDEAGMHSFFTEAVPSPYMSILDKKSENELKKKRAEVENALHRYQQVLKQSSNSKGYTTWREKSQNEQKKDVLDSLEKSLSHMTFDEKVDDPNKLINGVIGKAVKLTGDDPVNTEVGNFKREQPFSISLWIQLANSYDRAVIVHRSRAWTDAGSRGYQLLVEDGKLAAGVIHFEPGNMVYVKSREKLPVKKWIHVVMSWDGSSRASGLNLYMNGKPVEVEILRDHLTKTMQGGGGDNITLGERFRDRGFKEGMLDEFRVYDRKLTTVEIQHLADRDNSAWNSVTDAQLEEYYLMSFDEQVRESCEELKKVRAALFELEDQTVDIMVMEEMPKPRITNVLYRGNYDQPRELVTANVPEFLRLNLEMLPGNQGKKDNYNRKDLAYWTVDSRNPLTPRVTINRFWQQFFGIGFVRTPEDFGHQGELSTHPLLIDWLAADFIDHDWDVKHLIKLIVTSNTYKQSSSGRHFQVKKSWELDPENRYLARSNTRRLSAEMVRDQSLALGGMLNDEIGGEPMRPFDVEESFKPLKRDNLHERSRRSLYIHWRRNSAPPVMVALDASGREVCRIKRDTTASPLQTLILFNGPEFVESSRNLAESLIIKYKSDHKTILSVMFRQSTGRTPDAKELSLLEELYTKQLDFYQQHKEEAELYLKIGDLPVKPGLEKNQLAAMAIVAQTLLNYHEAMYIP